MAAMSGSTPIQAGRPAHSSSAAAKNQSPAQAGLYFP
jgi:hypothetical protein